MITEVTVLQLQEDSDLQNPESLERKTIRDVLSRKLHEESASFAYYGQSIEHPETAFTFVGLGASGDGEDFEGSLANQDPIAPFQDLLGAGKAATVMRVHFQPTSDTSPALGNHASVGVTEVVLYHFPSDLSNKEEVMESIDKMRPVLARSEALVCFDGWVMEQTTKNVGEKSQVYVNVLGWVDVDAHMRFQDSDDFKQNIHHLMDIRELRLLEMHHVKMHAL
ncbi:MAG: hypothetical protein Q9184_005801 [Pyrenodesmia sp. 2 TL-2023]